MPFSNDAGLPNTGFRATGQNRLGADARGGPLHGISKGFAGLAVALGLALPMAIVASLPAAAKEWTFAQATPDAASKPVEGQWGALKCTVDRTKDAIDDRTSLAASCVFKPTSGDDGWQRYVGTINKVGVTEAEAPKLVLIWSVLSDQVEPTPGFLTSTFRGRVRTDDPSIGPTKSLIGGPKDQIKLVPLSEDAANGLRPTVIVTLQLDKVKL